MRRIVHSVALVVAVVGLASGGLVAFASTAGAQGGYTPATTPVTVTAKADLVQFGYVPRTSFCTTTTGSATPGTPTGCNLTQPAYLRATSIAAATHANPFTPVMVAFWDGVAPGATVAFTVGGTYGTVTNAGTGVFYVQDRGFSRVTAPPA